jgi:hypothetical protein
MTDWQTYFACWHSVLFKYSDVSAKLLPPSLGWLSWLKRTLKLLFQQPFEPLKPLWRRRQHFSPKRGDIWRQHGAETQNKVVKKVVIFVNFFLRKISSRSLITIMHLGIFQFCQTFLFGVTRNILQGTDKYEYIHEPNPFALQGSWRA